MPLHRLKKSEIDQAMLERELARLAAELESQLGAALVELILFGSAVKGTAAMHPYSDIDLCAVVAPGTPIKELYGSLPRSAVFPVDWLVVERSEFDEKVKKQHGVYFLAASEGRKLKGRS